jgi:hypothetical protein
LRLPVAESGDAVGGGFLVGDAPEVRGMDDAAVDAIEQRLLEFRVAVAERVHRDAGQRIEVFLAGFVPQPHAFASHERHRLAGVRVHDVAHGGSPQK